MSGIIVYQKGFVEVSFPYNPKFVSFIKQNFLNSRFDGVKKAWLIPIYLQKEREALKTLVEEEGFREVKKRNPEESSGFEIDVLRNDLLIKFISPSWNNFDLLVSEAPLETLKEFKGAVKKIRKRAFWDKEAKATRIGLSEDIGEYILQTNWDRLFLQNKFEPYWDRLLTSVELGRATDIDVELKGGDFLFPFQKAGILVLAYRLKKYGGQILGDEMGLGKTIQAGGLIRGKKLFPALVITPASLKFSFADKLENFYKLDVKVLSGKNPYTIPQGDVVVINYDILDNWKKKLKTLNFKILVADEAHYLKNPTAKRTRATKYLAKEIPYKLLMTGTPWQNHPEELWSLLEISGLDKFVALNERDFKNRFVFYDTVRVRGGEEKLVPVAGKNEDELRLKLFSKCMVRRTKEQVLRELPPKIVSAEKVEITNRDEYERYMSEDMLESAFEYLRDKGIDIPSEVEEAPFNEAMEWLLEHHPAVFAEKFGKAFELLGLGKVKATLDYVEDFFEQNPNGKLVVFAYHKKVQEELFKKLKKYNPLWLKGEMSPEDKAKIEKTFNEKEDNRILVASLLAGKEGLTLTRANTTIFAELWFNPQDLKQAEDRIHRIGQKETAYIYYLIGKDTIDEEIWDKLNERMKSFKRTFQRLDSPKRIMKR